MHILQVSPQAIEQALQILHSGGVLAHATETCYGLACDLTNPDAVRRLFDIKKRSYGQPVSALFSSLEQAMQYVIFSPRALDLAKKHLPGPLTLVLPLLPTAPAIYVIASNHQTTKPVHHQTTIGVRLSSHPFAQELVEKFGKPLATTSANIHGEANPYSVADIESQWKNAEPKPDLAVDSGKLVVQPPSSVILVAGDEITVLRQGSLVVL